MNIYGINFTSRPSRRKPITCIACTLKNDVLYAGELQKLPDFGAFENALRAPGPWIAGIDCPFSQSRTFIANIAWPRTWTGMVDHVSSMDRKSFRKALDDYRNPRTALDAEAVSGETGMSAVNEEPKNLVNKANRSLPLRLKTWRSARIIRATAGRRLT